jgi:hypothetical protein
MASVQLRIVGMFTGSLAWRGLLGPAAATSPANARIASPAPPSGSVTS